MGKTRVNFLEGEDFIDKGAGKKKRRGFDRMPTDKKYARIRDMDSEGENEPKVINFKPKKPVDATSVHSGPSIPKPADKSDTSRIEPVKASGKKPYSPKNDLEYWNNDDNKMLNAVADVLDKASDEKLAKIEKEIAEFSPAEQRFIDPMAEDYSNEFWEERRKIEAKGIKATDRWVSAFRDSYINKRLGWGSERQLASEKKTILEKYLNLKLPVDVPPEKTKDVEGNTGETKNEALKDLTITNKNMEKHINIEERVKQNREELTAAEMMPNVADPKIVSGDSSLAESFPVSDDIKRKKEIRKISDNIFLERKELDPNNHEVGPSEDDLRKAEGVYDTMQGFDKQDNPVVEPGPEVAQNTAEPKPDTEPSAPEKTIEESKADMDAKRLAYAQLDLDKSRKWTKLKNLLGAGIKEVKDEDFERAKSEYEQARSLYFDAKKAEVLTKGDKEGAREFLREFEGADEATKFLNLKYDLKKEQSDYPAKALYGFEKLANGWKEMSWKKKLAVSAAIFGVGALAGLTGGASFGFIGATAFTLRTVQRTLGAGAMYIGAKKWQDTRSLNKIQRKSEDRINTLLSNDDWLKRIENLESKHVSTRFDFKKEQIEALDKKHKRRALALAGLIGIGGTAFDMYRQGYFGAIGKKFTGLGSAVKEKMLGSSILASSISAEQYASVQGAQGLGGGAAATQAHEVTGGNIPESQFQKPSIVPEAEQPYHQEYSSENRATEGGANFEQADRPSDRILYEYDTEGKIKGLSPRGDEYFKQYNIEPHGSLKPEVQAPEIAKPQFEDISVKIKAGGNMWGSIENNIKANPSAYGLDQTDPNFKTNMNGKISEMLHDFAKKNGLSYKQLDKVFEGDNFKIGHDAAGKPYLYDFHGKAFGADVSHGGAGAAQEIVPSKGNIPIEDAKPRTGVADHQPRGGGKMKFPPEVEALESKARASAAKALESQQYADSLKAQSAGLDAVNSAANTRIFLGMRPRLYEIFQGAGFSNHANIGGSSALECYNQIMDKDYIADDVILADKVKELNDNTVKIIKMFLKFGKPSGGMSMDDYWRSITSKSGNLPSLNTIISKK